MDKELLLSNYFSNCLSLEDKILFDELLLTDADFKAQFDLEFNLKRAIKNSENEKLKAKLTGFEQELKRTLPGDLNESKSRHQFRNWAIAASIALLIGLGYFGYNTFSGADYNKLYASNFEQYPNTVYTITRGEGEETIEREAFAAYEAGE
ncbi:MAG: hypothetical protein WBM83_16535, partial [Flavobacteriaceae bacterium]